MSSETGSPALSIRDLRVDYGDFVAVRDISVDIARGEVFGLVGPNGAGKTSTFSVLATLLEPTYGEIRLAGHDLLEDTAAVRRLIGYMPDLAPVPSDLKLREFLNYYARVHNIGPRQVRKERVEEVLELVNLSDKAGDWCHKMSRGQTQRLVLAKTLLHRPEILILDEPASGLDPLSRRELRGILRELARDGVTVLISSHILTELAEMCTSLCVMNRGEILASGSASAVRQKLGSDIRTLRIGTYGSPTEVSSALADYPGVSEIIPAADHLQLHFRGEEQDQARLLAHLVRQDFPITTFTETTSTFEEILVQVAQANQATR